MLKPCGSKILVKKLSNESMTKGGIIMESATPFAQGEVLAVGPGRHNASGILLKCDLKLGISLIFILWLWQKLRKV